MHVTWVTIMILEIRDKGFANKKKISGKNFHLLQQQLESRTLGQELTDQHLGKNE